MKRVLIGIAVLAATWVDAQTRAGAQDKPSGIAIQPVTPITAPTATQFVPPVANDVGRYQAVVVQDGSRGTVVMLLDTREGATWIYRPPQGNAVNGFWSDIPRLTYAPEFWRNIFNQPQATGTNAPAPATITPQR